MKSTTEANAMQLSKETQTILDALVAEGNPEAAQLQADITKRKIKSINQCRHATRWGDYVMLHQLGLSVGPLYFIGIDPLTQVKMVEFMG
ncbi:hypothetical protein HWB92_gp092 [Serratia phage vB_SmaA_3M]|uniref:Uncharacterized protein n=1 Tax=Serratia phage vB_SmaA_3M TaxID=2419930 RepID=A0A3G2YS69_9CAUD|nr:hypothetical protein HWB92_gp092 [Serratia phage vB_SmaA_3M]AYP28350.1 hypothetical protein 3M_094 [Serratia phage vB_SmaA_3M]